MWEIRKYELYDSDSGPSQLFHYQSSPGDLTLAEGQRNGNFGQNCKFGWNGKLGHSCVRVTKGRLYDSQVRDHVIVHLGLNVSSSAYNLVMWLIVVMLWQQYEYYYYDDDNVILLQ